MKRLVDQNENPDFWGIGIPVKCQPGVWQKFSIEQREIQPGKVLRTFRHGNEILHQDLSDIENTMAGEDVNVHLSYDTAYFSTAGDLAEVRNFYLQELEPCLDPCDGYEDCTTFVNSCEAHVGLNINKHLFGNFTASMNMKISFEYQCEPDAEDRHIVFFTELNSAGNPSGSFNERYHALYIGFSNKDYTRHFFHVSANDNTDRFSSPNYEICESKEWVRVDIETKEKDQTNVLMTSRENSIWIRQLGYSKSHIKKERPLLLYLGRPDIDYSSVFPYYKVRNIKHQAFPDMGSCPDPCYRLENCVTYVDSCEITPTSGTKTGVMYLPTLTFKLNIDIKCPTEMVLNQPAGKANNLVSVARFSAFNAFYLEIRRESGVNGTQQLYFNRDNKNEWLPSDYNLVSFQPDICNG